MLAEEKKRQAEEEKLLAEEKKRQAEEEKLLAEEKKRQAEEEKRLAEEQKRMAEEAKKLAEELKKKAEEEQRLAEEAKKVAEEQKRKAEEDRKRKEAELALQELLAEEQAALDDETQKLRDQAKAEYISEIIAKVKRNWIRPPGSATDLTCRIRVEQIPGGEVTGTEIIESSGVPAFDRAVVAAVNKSSPLPKPKDPSVFARVLNFTFIP